jgi:LacI family transcriptional regulator
MSRPTIRDVAHEAGLSVSTVNRVLAGALNVRSHTVRQVRDAAEKIGFYGTGAIQSHAMARTSKFRFGFLLLQPSRIFYRLLGAALETAARQNDAHDIQVQIVFAEDLTPQIVSAKMLELGDTCDAIGVVAAVHPLVNEAIDELSRRDIPVFALISQLAATGSVNYVGLDNWKVGRMFAWAIANLCKEPGKVGILVGNHRFRCQDMNESGFRSYFREFAPEFALLEPLSTFETSAVAEEMTERLIREHPDMKGLAVMGGGISGTMNALRTMGKAGEIVTVGHQLMDNTRLGLVDGTLALVISNSLERLATETINGMIRACKMKPETTSQTIVLPFEILTRENI